MEPDQSLRMICSLPLHRDSDKTMRMGKRGFFPSSAWIMRDAR